MKKALPVIIAIVLILAIGGFTFGKQIMDKYSYSDEVYDLTVYFENTSEKDVAIIMQDQFMAERATLLDGTYYVDLDTVHNYFNEQFYFDDNEGVLIYTLPLDMIKVAVGDSTAYGMQNSENLGYVACRYENNKLLVALDYVKKYTNFSYEAFIDPGRLQIYTQWNDRTVATVKKDTQIRHRGGVKSEILKEVKAGDKLIVIEQMEEWSKVKSNDAIIGFVENKKLENLMPELPIPVSDYVEPEYTNVCRPHKINMGWHAIAGVGGNDTFDSYTSITKGLNVIAPTWFSLSDNNGNFSDYSSADYVAKAHNAGMEVWAVFDNIEHSSDIDMSTILGNTTIRQQLIDNMINTSLSLGIEGINVDFEMLPSETGEAFSEFIRELSIPCRVNGLVLSIDNYVPIGGTGYYDRKTQGEVADYVVIMGYDEHYAGSTEAGSVASIDYVDKGIQMTLEEVPASKIINGIPFYTRIWEINGTELTSQAVDMATVNEWLSNHSLTKEWDDATCQNYAEYTDGSKTCKCWIEDAESIKVKLNVMKSYGIGGVAEWRLGYESADVWDVIEEYLNN